MITARSWCLLALLTSISVAGCDENPVDNTRHLLGTATLAVETSTGSWTSNTGEAAFYVYNNGPTPDDRAMYLVLSAGGGKQSSVEIEFFQFLEANATSPKAGTYRTRYGALGGDPTLGGSILYLENGKLIQVFPVEDSSTVKLSEVTPDRVTGSVSMVLKRNVSSAVPDVRISGTFQAVRVQNWEDLPRPVSGSRR